MTSPTEGRRIYAVGDVHGCRNLLEDMLARIAADLETRPHGRPLVVMLGDYVDRGPDTRGVLDMLTDLAKAEVPAAFLLGNHDACLLAYLRDPDWRDRALHWLHPVMGGAETVASYGVDPRGAAAEVHGRFATALPAAHLAFLDACRLWLRVGAYAFVHAGIRPGVPLDAQDPEDLIWIREPFLTSRAGFGFKVVHGHTIVPRVEHHPNRIAVDTGAVRSGVLSCVVLEDEDVALLGPDGPAPLPQTGGGSRLGRSVRGLFRGR